MWPSPLTFTSSSSIEELDGFLETDAVLMSFAGKAWESRPKLRRDEKGRKGFSQIVHEINLYFGKTT